MTPRRQVAVLIAPILLAGCGVLTSAPVVPPTPPAPTPPTDPSLSSYYDQDVRWTNCGAADCATLVAPRDYARPMDGTIDLAITRVRATGERIGTLFVNPGGPGGSAVNYAKAADSIVGAPVRERFDIVGIDPRGVGSSEPVSCMSDQEMDDLAAMDGTPDSESEEQALVSMAQVPGLGCQESSGDLMAYVGTVDSARDLDIARSVVGDDVLNFLGVSYGSMLGATYAELFPDRVGRMVLDGALPTELDIVEVTHGQAIGFELALRSFVSDCLTHGDCPLDGDATVEADVDAALEDLRAWIAARDEDPLPAGDRELNEALAAYAILTYLYVPEYDYPRLREALGKAIVNGDGKPLLALLDARVSRGPDGRYTDNSTEAFYAVTCLDRPYLGTVDEVRMLASDWSAEAPTFGPSLAWGLLACKDWPAAAERITSTTAAGANPILVVSTTGDPATPYEWGKVLADSLESGRLLTYDSIGHTAYQNGSSCVDHAIDEYLISGSVPAEGTICT